MKKVKKLLLTAVAALSLSACSFEDVKGYAVTAGEKIVEVWNNLLEKVGLKKKDEKKSETPCKHKDENGDFKCDVCGEELAIKSVALDTKDVKTVYAVGDEFDPSGVKVIATSEVGSKKELEFSVSSPDMSTAGAKTVTVTAQAGGETKTFTYAISVTYWSDDDLAVFKKVSFSSYAPLPYLAGHNMRTEVQLDETEESIESWHIVADGIDADSYLEYYGKLKEYNEVVLFGSTEVTFSLKEVTVSGSEGFHGLSDVSIFVLMPSYIDSNDEESRAFTEDEYLIVGINEDSQLIVENRFVDATLDGLFFGTEFAIGRYGFPEKYIYYADHIGDPINSYYSELSHDKFLLPSLENATFVTPTNIKSKYPLLESLDDYDLVWDIDLEDATEEDLANYVAALVGAGFEKQTNGSGADAFDSYVLNTELEGYMKFIPEYYSVEYQGATYVGIETMFYYIAPEEYTTRITEDINALMAGLQIDDFEVDNEDYPDEEYSAIYFSYALEEEQTLDQAFEAMGNKLGALGFSVTEEAEYDDFWEWWTVSLSNYSTLNLEVYCYEYEGEVCYTVYASKYYEFEVSDVIAAVYGESVPTEVEPGYYYSVVAYGEGETPSLQSCATLLQQIALGSGGVGEISTIDGNAIVPNSNQSGVMLSGCTKDGSVVYTLTVRAGQDGYYVILDVAEITTLEAYARALHNEWFGDYYGGAFFDSNSTSAIRNYSYFETQSGSIAFDIYLGVEWDSNIDYFVTNFIDDFTYYLDEGYEQVGETEVDEETGVITLAFANEIYTVVVTFYPFAYEYQDGEDTVQKTLIEYVMEISENTQSESI